MRRQGSQAASLRVSLDGEVRLEQLAGDGLATAAGSAAYNVSAGGLEPLKRPVEVTTT